MTSGKTAPEPGPRRRALVRRGLAAWATAAVAATSALGPAAVLAQGAHSGQGGPGGQGGQAMQGARAAFELETLMALLAQRKSGEARFTEERTVNGFDAPLRASGTLSFTAPDRFARHTLLPRRESLEVLGQTLRLTRSGRTRQLTLDAVPELAALIEGLRGTLTGNAALLRKHFEVRLAGQAGLWTLTLVPRDTQLAAQVRSLEMVGTGSELRTVDLTMAGDERSLMTIEPIVAAAAPAATVAPAAAPPASR